LPVILKQLLAALIAALLAGYGIYKAVGRMYRGKNGPTF
jgi:hypothetical protein